MKSFHIRPARILCAALVAAALAAVFIACASNYILVDVPPKMDLSRFKTVGVIEFDAGEHTGLAVQTTRRFIETLQSAQPGTLVLELGRQSQLLKAAGKDRLDAEAVKAIAERKKVDAVFSGVLEVSDEKTEVNVRSLSLRGVSAKVSVDASLRVKLWHTASGALAWSGSSSGEWTLAKASVTRIRISDPDAMYDKMVDGLVFETTRDFRPTRERKYVDR